MKLAISGKGGVGKSTVAAVVAEMLARRGKRVLAVDADPDANLAAALGITPEAQQGIVPIARQVALVEERTGAKVNQYGQIFRLNPEVSDIADNYAYRHNGVALLVLGAVAAGGGGCGCPENVLIRALVTDLVLYKDDALVMDMEAGVEHLGRATARGVDKMLIVVEPGQRSIDCALRVIRMGREIGLNRFGLIANKVAGPADERFIREAMPDTPLLGVIPYCEEIRLADRNGHSVAMALPAGVVAVFEKILQQLESEEED